MIDFLLAVLFGFMAKSDFLVYRKTNDRLHLLSAIGEGVIALLFIAGLLLWR